MSFWKRHMKKQNNGGEEVERLKLQTHEVAGRAEDSIQQLNSLLRANGITLNIYRASHGHHK